MIKIFYGDNRVAIQDEINKVFGEEYEVFEGENLTVNDLPSIFFGTSLFGEQRKIVIKDMGENKVVFDKLPDYLKTNQDVILFESKLDKRTTTFKAIKEQIEMREFKTVEKVDVNLVFDIYRTAKRDGALAVKMLEKIENEQDPYMFFGLLSSQAIKDFSLRQGTKEKKVLMALSDLDIKMKTTSSQPFLLLKSFLLQVSTL